MPDWSDLELLHALLYGGTLTRAAEALRIDQTTASRRLSRAEKRLGGALFDRIDGRLVPTPLLAEARAALGLMADASTAAHASLRQARLALTGRVSISCLGFHATEMLAPGLATLIARHPRISVDLVPEDRLASIEKRDVDIAIRLAEPSDHVALMRRLAVFRFRRYRAAEARGENACILIYPEHLSHLPEMVLMSRLRPGAAVAMRANHLHALARAAASIGGETMLPEAMGDRDPGLKRVDADGVFAERTAYLLVHPERRQSPSVAAVVEWLVGLHSGG
jgi:DNA-binding transcriptional LysR family regulator